MSVPETDEADSSRFGNRVDSREQERGHKQERAPNMAYGFRCHRPIVADHPRTEPTRGRTEARFG